MRISYTKPSTSPSTQNFPNICYMQFASTRNPLVTIFSVIDLLQSMQKQLFYRIVTHEEVASSPLPMKPLIVKIYMGSGVGKGGDEGRHLYSLLPPPPSSPTDIVSATKEFFKSSLLRCKLIFWRKTIYELLGIAKSGSHFIPRKHILYRSSLPKARKPAQNNASNITSVN